MPKTDELTFECYLTVTKKPERPFDDCGPVEYKFVLDESSGLFVSEDALNLCSLDLEDGAALVKELSTGYEMNVRDYSGDIFMKIEVEPHNADEQVDGLKYRFCNYTKKHVLFTVEEMRRRINEFIAKVESLGTPRGNSLAVFREAMGLMGQPVTR